MVMRRGWLAWVLVSLGCASAPLTKPAQVDLSRADALILQGCYDCLLEARAIYERVAIGKVRPLVVERLFEAELLITLREKELALDASASLAGARDLARELPPTLDAPRAVALVEAVPADSMGWPRRETEAFRRDHLAIVPRIDDELTWLEQAALRQPVRQYLALAIDCSYASRGRPRVPPVPPGRSTPPAGTAATQPGATSRTGQAWVHELPPDAPPLVRYRAAICRTLSQPALEKVRADEPRFVETAFFLGQLAAAYTKRDGGRLAKTLLTEAYGRFPTSPAVTYMNGNFNQLAGDCRTALRLYEETLTLKNVHEDALLGRTICLTFLKRMDEAVDVATHMIELGTDNMSDAYYWRAWIRHFQQHLDRAREDIDRAKALAYNEDIYTLAGIIEHDQNDLDPAQRDLETAKTSDSRNRNCTAMWYLGLVQMKRERWLESAGDFTDAMACYEASVKEDEEGLQAIQAREDIDPDFKARQVAGFEAALTEDRSQQFAAAFNAANRYAQGGDLAKARALVDIAARDPSLADRVAQLRQIIKDRPPAYAARHF
jgi:tetratricopeptide (TPR) repeat protein